MTSEVRTFETTALDPYARGRELGLGCGTEVNAAYARYTELWTAYGVTADEVREVGAAVLGPIEAFSPTLRAEIAGIAAGAGLDEWQLGALNARSELLALGDRRLVAAGVLPGEPSECSTVVAVPRNRAPLTAQTWDWHTPLRDSWFVWTLRLPGGRSIRTLTEYGIVAKIGVATETAAGGTRHGTVGVGFNALRHTADTGSGSVPVHLVTRRVLDEAQTLDEATKIAAEAGVSASAAVTVTARDAADGDWAAATIELHPGGPSVLAHRQGEAGRWLAHTNHFLSDRVPREDEVPSEVSTSRPRLDRVERLARAMATQAGPDGPQALAEALASHDLGPLSVCAHGNPLAPVGQRSATLAVAVAEPATGRLHVHAGRPCEARTDTWWSGG